MQMRVLVSWEGGLAYHILDHVRALLPERPHCLEDINDALSLGLLQQVAQGDEHTGAPRSSATHKTDMQRNKQTNHYNLHITTGLSGQNEKILL